MIPNAYVSTACDAYGPTPHRPINDHLENAVSAGSALREKRRGGAPAQVEARDAALARVVVEAAPRGPAPRELHTVERHADLELEDALIILGSWPTAAVQLGTTSNQHTLGAP